MKKDNVFKTLKLLLIILFVVLISLISFIGVYVQDKSITENVLPEYALTRELDGHRRIVLTASNDTNETTGEKVNSEESLNSENYKKSKEIIEKRIKTMGVSDYIIRQNEDNGDIVIELPESEIIDHVIGNLPFAGKFEIVDHDTGEVLMTNDDLESVIAGYGTTQSNTTAIIINIQFNKEGTEKFKNITNTYVETTATGDAGAEGEDETKTEAKQIAIKIEDTELLETYFDEEISNGLLQLTMAKSSNSTAEEMQEYLIEASSLASLMGSGKMPIVYKVDQNKFIYSEITQHQINILAVISIVVFTVAMIYVVVRYKIQGILSTISLIGYAALLLLAIRYFNVEVSVGSVIGIVFGIALDYAILISILEKKNVLKVVKKYAIGLVPALIISVVFTFMNIALGPVLFWVIVILMLYNISITKLLMED